MVDIVIVGGGPAGLSAAIYTARANQDTVVLERGDATVQRVQEIDNYLGFPDGISGPELIELGRKQATRFGADIRREEVLSVTEHEETYLVETEAATYEPRGIILATGASFKKPGVDGLDQFEGKGVSYCVQCDAFFFRDRPVVVLGAQNLAAKEALLLLDYTDDVTILTDGADVEMDQRLRDRLDEENVPIVQEEVTRIDGDEKLHRVILSNREIPADGLFVAVGEASGSDLARQLGIPLDGAYLDVDEELNTGLPRVYAAGDCTGGNRQVATAVGEGAEAAINLLEELRGARYVDYG